LLLASPIVSQTSRSHSNGMRVATTEHREKPPWRHGPSTAIFLNEVRMLYTIAVVLVILWLLGLVTSYTVGGFIHVLLVIAIVIVLLRVIRGDRPL